VTGEEQPPEDDLMTIGAAAAAFGISLHLLAGWVAEGRVASVIVDRRQMVRLADLKAVVVEGRKHCP
jgi:hypothetical protein